MFHHSNHTDVVKKVLIFTPLAEIAPIRPCLVLEWEVEAELRVLSLCVPDYRCRKKGGRGQLSEKRRAPEETLGANRGRGK